MALRTLSELSRAGGAADVARDAAQRVQRRALSTYVAQAPVYARTDVGRTTERVGGYHPAVAAERAVLIQMGLLRS